MPIMPCTGYTLRVNNKHADVDCEIRDALALLVRQYIAEDTIVPGEQVKVVRNSGNTNEIVAVEIEIKPPNGSWSHGADVILGGAIAYMKWSISEIGFTGTCGVSEIIKCGADSLPPFPGW